MGDKVIPVRVALRCRPLIPKEEREGCTTCLQFVPGEPQVLLGQGKSFTYDYIFTPSTSQEEVYEKSVSSLVKAIFRGYNATVLAYGQTGSGKTFSMGGGYDLGDNSTNDELVGVIPRVIKSLFKGIKEKNEFEFNVRVSYLELYKEDLFDLLEPIAKRDKDAVAIREDVNGGIRLTGLKEIQVEDEEELLACLERGASGRTTGATAMNSSSSRSHAIFTIVIERTNKTDSQDYCKSKFHLVDLAGSERAKKTRAEGERFKEGVNINKGLLALGNVISALGEEGAQKRSHIPYRDSKLTRLLQDSLGGNSHTLMIACVSPADTNMEETLSTLRYADRARKIKNKPVINRDPQAAEILRLRSVVQQLQAQVMSNGGPVNMNTSNTEEKVNVQALKDKIKRLEEEKKEMNEALSRSLDQVAELSEKLIIAEGSRDHMNQKLQELKRMNGLHMSLLNDTKSGEKSHVEVEAEQRRLAEDIHNTLLQLEADETELDEEYTEDTPNTSANESQPGSANNSFSENKEEEMQRRLKNRVGLNKELQHLTKMLHDNEVLRKKMEENEKISELKAHYEESMQGLQTNLESLQGEMEKLKEQLDKVKRNPASQKVAEQRRIQIREKEQRIQDLQKQMREQSRQIKMKKNAEQEYKKISDNIQTIKQQRVKLIKQLKEEAEMFRKYKQAKEKEVIQLKAKDRKRDVEFNKLNQKHERQQAVLKRKAEEAVAVNKRLKEALAKQKSAAEDRDKKFDNQKLPMKDRVRRWVQGDLEVAVSLQEVRKQMEDMMEHRRQLTGGITRLEQKMKVPTIKKKRLNNSRVQNTSVDLESLTKERDELKKDLQVCNAHITEIQQRMVDLDPEEKARTRWNGIHTLVEAKVVMAQLFNSAVTFKVDVGEKSRQIKELRAAVKESKQEAEEVVDEAKAQIDQYEADLNAMRREHQDRISHMLKKLHEKEDFSGLDQHSLDEKVQKDLQYMRNEIENFNDMAEELERKKNECLTLRQENTKLKFTTRTGTNQLMPSFDADVKSEAGTPPMQLPKTPITECNSFFASPTIGTSPALNKLKKAKRLKAHRKRKSAVLESGSEEESFSAEEEFEDDHSNDPDWRQGLTPAGALRHLKRQTSVSHGIAAIALRSESLEDTDPGIEPVTCQCNGKCNTKRCKCKKVGNVCADSCKCPSNKCLNREIQLPESTTTESQDELTIDSQASLNSTFVMAKNEPEEKSNHNTTVKANVLKDTNNVKDVKASKRKSEPENDSLTHDESSDSLLNTMGVKSKKKKLLPKKSKFFENLDK